MSGDVALGVLVTGLDSPGAPSRPGPAVLAETRHLIALLATRDTYIAQPRLWELGENGRARTIEDFEHHLKAAMSSDRQWSEHLAYCVSLFTQRGFPLRWLTEAFDTLARVLPQHLPADTVADAVRRLSAAPARVVALAAAAGTSVDAPTRYDR